jgi:hypothetical protein
LPELKVVEAEEPTKTEGRSQRKPKVRSRQASINRGRSSLNLRELLKTRSRSMIVDRSGTISVSRDLRSVYRRFSDGSLRRCSPEDTARILEQVKKELQAA